MNASYIPIVLAVLTLIGTVITVAYSRKTSDRASAVQIMELGMTKFVENLENSLAKCEGKCEELEGEMAEMERDIVMLRRRAEDDRAKIEKLEEQVVKLNLELGRLP